MTKAKAKATMAQAADDSAATAHIIAGTRLPDVALTATFGAPVNLARFQERAVVFVYPFTGTPGQPNPPGWDDIPGAHGSTPEAEASPSQNRTSKVKARDVSSSSTKSTADPAKPAAAKA